MAHVTLSTAHVSSGIMGVVGNKGAVGIWMTLYNSKFCFVCAHLAAGRGDSKLVARNENYDKILDEMEFATAVGGVDRKVCDADFAFFLGDLNYRISKDLDIEIVFEYIEKDNIRHLMNFDQLTLQRAGGAVFSGWTEGTIAFRPTYKFTPGGEGYDRDPDGKQRAPAWCDRVLWRTLSPARVTQTCYTSVESELMSDHKPVKAVFAVDIDMSGGGGAGGNQAKMCRDLHSEHTSRSTRIDVADRLLEEKMGNDDLSFLSQRARDALARHSKSVASFAESSERTSSRGGSIGSVGSVGSVGSIDEESIAEQTAPSNGRSNGRSKGRSTGSGGGSEGSGKGGGGHRTRKGSGLGAEELQRELSMLLEKKSLTGEGVWEGLYGRGCM